MHHNLNAFGVGVRAALHAGNDVDEAAVEQNLLVGASCKVYIYIANEYNNKYEGINKKLTKKIDELTTPSVSALIVTTATYLVHTFFLIAIS